ncbi:chaperone protein dnaJ 20, chloroplastic-like [Zingiber officinale]|uniref:chaperone protein dnaJ 20, chloroplastic-like n=1 Tax=Zingiber officinale TaxID=94328 RepID=UPI001C4D8F52|nr:chaperone protein dnaJ 20, chloroplastic-like [Zingiber officinale]
MAILAVPSPSLAFRSTVSTPRTPRQVRISAAAPTAVARTMYDLLSVSRTAGPEEIRAAYRRLALRWHPDTCRSPAGEERRRHAERFMAAREAYEVLSDPSRRRSYDLAIAYDRWAAAVDAAAAFRPEGRARRRGGAASGGNWKTQLDGLGGRSAVAEAGGEETWGARLRRTRRADSVS